MERDAPIVEVETMPDQVHLLVPCDPQYGIQRLVTQRTGRSSRLRRKECPALRSRLPRLWTNRYFVATLGGATPEVVKKHAQNQRTT